MIHTSCLPYYLVLLFAFEGLVIIVCSQYLNIATVKYPPPPPPPPPLSLCLSLPEKPSNIFHLSTRGRLSSMALVSISFFEWQREDSLPVESAASCHIALVTVVISQFFLNKYSFCPFLLYIIRTVFVVWY